jgi:energy-coupling factor transport system permease protein
VPSIVSRAGTIAAAQRARGLDTEGGIRARLRGVIPLVAPVMLSSLTEVEERSLALEVRGFGRPGRRHLLWWAPDTGWERALRWLLIAALVGLVAGRVAGAIPPTP